MTASAREAEQGLEQRRRAEESRTLAAEHRARAHELRAGVNAGGDTEAVDSDAYLHAGIEEVLAEVAELRAAGFDERALACDSLVQAETADEGAREGLMRQASASVLGAAALEAQAIALRDELRTDGDLHDALSDAAMARARAREQRSLATAARAQGNEPDGAVAELQRLRADRHDAWAELHERLALAHRLRAEGLAEPAETSAREAERLRGVAQAAERRVSAAERRAVDSVA